MLLSIDHSLYHKSLPALDNYLADHFPRCRHEALLPHQVRLLETEAELLCRLARLTRLKTGVMQWGSVVKSVATLLATLLATWNYKY